MDEKISFNFIEKGDYAPREGLPYVRRNNVAAIIRYDKKYLFIFWNEVNYGYSLITGGIEGEEKIEALKREIIEESGYYDFKNIVAIDCINISKFYVEHKNQNREAVYYPYLVELNSLSKHDVDNFEEKEHSCVWVDEEDLDSIKLFENHRRMLNVALEYKEII